MKYIIGIDQGSTKTLGAISDENGNILYISRTEGADHKGVGLALQIQRINEVCIDLIDKSYIDKVDIKCIYGGLTGVDWPEEADLLKNEILRLKLCDKVYAVNDSLVALRAGTSKSFGAIIIAGTGGNFGIISPNGDEFVGAFQERAILGGRELGTRTLETLYRSYIGVNQKTILTEKVRRKYKNMSIPEILQKRKSLSEICSLAPLVFEAACDGDSVAINIIRDFGENFAEIINARARISKMTELDFEVVLSGSIFKGQGDLLKKTIREEINKVCPRAIIKDAEFEPVVGAVLLGIESFDIKSEKYAENVRRTAEKHNLKRNINRRIS